MVIGRGEYQKQLAALVAKAKADNYQFDDILPDALKDHFQEMAELKQARKYVKELEEREKELEEEKITLVKKLGEKQTEIVNMAAEHEDRKIELHQARRQIALYKETSEDHSKRAERYRRQLKDIVGQKEAAASAAEKIEALNNQIVDQQAVIDKLSGDNRKSEAMFRQLREADIKALGRKDKQLTKKDEMLAELRRQIEDAQICKATSSLDDDSDTETLVDGFDDESLTLQEQNIDLLQQNLSLSHENEALTNQYVMVKTELCELTASCNCATIQDQKNQHCAAVISEIKTLNRFYTSAFDVLDDFAKAFHASKGDIPSPAYIADQLDMAQEALAGYNSVKQVVRAVTDMSSPDLDQLALYKELDSLGAAAVDSMSSLEVLSAGFWGFLNQLSDDPKLLSRLNGALCDADRPRVVDFYFCD